jgi:hypothetical protein
VDDPTVSFSPSISLKAKWGFFKLDSATLTAALNERIALGVGADAGAQCDTKDPGIGLLPHPVTLPEVDIQVGPVPVVIVPKLQLYLTGHATISAQASAMLTQSATATVGASYSHGQFSPISTLSDKFTPSFTAGGDASAEVALTPTVETEVYGVAGPSFDLGVAAKFGADTSKNPWWTLEGCLQGGVGFDFDLLDLNWSDPHLLSACKILLRAQGGGVAAGGGTQSGTGATGGGTYAGTSGTGGSPSGQPPASTSITYEGAPETGGPPSTLGDYTMQPFAADSSPLGTLESSIVGPTGTVSFGAPLSHWLVGDGWQTWSNGYEGDVYMSEQPNEEGVVEATILLPPGTGAFYLYAEPDEFEDFSLTATAQDGTTSGATTVYGEGGARYFGFYAGCGDAITSIRVTDGAGDDALGIGEFGIAPTKSGC